jgi:hypothetical protein
MTLTQLRRALPRFDIEDHPYDIGYWLRIAGQRRPDRGTKQQQGWDRADHELKSEAVENSAGA